MNNFYLRGLTPKGKRVIISSGAGGSNGGAVMAGGLVLASIAAIALLARKKHPRATAPRTISMAKMLGKNSKSFLGTGMLG